MRQGASSWASVCWPGRSRRWPQGRAGWRAQRDAPCGRLFRRLGGQCGLRGTGAGPGGETSGPPAGRPCGRPSVLDGTGFHGARCTGALAPLSRHVTAGGRASQSGLDREPAGAGRRSAAVATRAPGARASCGIQAGRAAGPRLGAWSPPPLPERLGVHGLEEVLPGAAGVPHRLRRGAGRAVRRPGQSSTVWYTASNTSCSRANFTWVLAGWTFTSTAVTGSGDGQHAAGELTLHDLVAVALLQRRRQQLGLDEPAVDEKHLHGPGAPAHAAAR